MSDYKPVYLIYSKQDFLLKEAISRLKEKLCETQSLDYFEFDSVTSAEEVVNTAATMSLNLSKKILIYHGINQLKKNEQNILLDYVKNPNETSVLVMTTDKKDFSNELIKYAQKNKYFFTYEVPRGSRLVDWIIEKGKLYDCSLDREVAQYILEVVGDNLRVLNSEIKKLSIYANGKEINIKDIEKVIVNAKESSVFILVDAIGKRDAGEAVIMLNKILLDGEAPLRVFGMINRQFNLILKSKLLQEKGMTAAQIAGELKQRNFVITKCLEQGRNFTETSLKKIFQLLSETDYRLKTGASQSLNLEKMVCECINI